MKTILFVLLAFLWVSCSDPKSDNAQLTGIDQNINLDALKSEFLNGWNNHDSALIMNTISDDAVVMNDSIIHTGKNAIAANWVSGGIKVLSNIQTHSNISSTSEDIAYESGTYSLDLNIPNGPSLKERGNYTLIWEKQTDGAIKLKVIHIEDITRLPNIQ